MPQYKEEPGFTIKSSKENSLKLEHRLAILTMMRNILTLRFIKPMLQIRMRMKISSMMIASEVIATTNPAEQ